MTDHHASVPGAILHEAVDVALAGMFDAVEAAPIPERLRVLVERLETADRGKTASAA